MSNTVPANNEKHTKQKISPLLDSESNGVTQEKSLLRQFTYKFVGVLLSIAFALSFSLLLFQQYTIELLNDDITATLLSGIAISLLFFGYFLWLIRQQIKLSTKHKIAAINSAETNEILVELTQISKPKHSDFQQLHDTCKAHESTIIQQQQALQQLSKTIDAQQENNDKLLSINVTNEMQRYAILKTAVVSLMQYSQVNVEEKSKSNVALTKLYNQIELFYFIRYLQSPYAILKLKDINFVNSIHAIFLNKQMQYQFDDQQLFFSVSKSLQHYAKIDQSLFCQFVTLLIDINVVTSPFTQYHLQLQLQGKSTGQQHVLFKLEVKGKNLNAIPQVIENLINTRVDSIIENPLISSFQILLNRLHAVEISAQVTDEGYQFRFILPLALTDNIKKVLNKHVILNDVNISLFSNHKLLNKQVIDVVSGCSGTIEQFSEIENFDQFFSVKALTKSQCHLLIVSTDNAQTHIPYIKKQLAALPISMQPKLMLLQSRQLNSNTYGFFSVAEQPFCQDNFLIEVEQLLVSEHQSNQLLSAEQCKLHQYITQSITVLLAVDNPQQYQTMQRLLNLLGLQVYIVTTEEQQDLQWKTGRYCLLITEFINNVFLDMPKLLMTNIGIFSLTHTIKKNENFPQWHTGLLTKNSMLAELSETLSPWLSAVTQFSTTTVNEPNQLSVQKDLMTTEDVAITEIASSIIDRPENEISFDFTRYLQHQGTAEVALFMLDDYRQENHAQLDLLVHAIKAKDINKASDVILRLNINAKILSANDLQRICMQWSKFLSGNEIPKSLDNVNALIKDTRATLKAIDEYAETI